MAIPPTLPGSSPGTGAPPAPAAAGRGLRLLIWAGVIVLTMMMVSLPTVMLVFFGLLPSIVAWVIDRADQKYATFCVFGMNFAGLFPFLTDIWFEDHSVDAAIRIMTNVFDLIIIYGSAAFGWMMFIVLPPVITTFLSAMSERRLDTLQTQQKDIIEEWGENVATVVEPPNPGDPSPQQPAAAQ